MSLGEVSGSSVKSFLRSSLGHTLFSGKVVRRNWRITECLVAAEERGGNQDFHLTFRSQPS